MNAETVVVGAGSSGAVIAARTTERADREVLLVEAGPDYAAAGSLPRDLVDGTRNSMRAHDWGLLHVPAANAPVLDYPRGKVVGGSSAVNTCIALRGQPYDYDEWGQMGLADWSWERCLPAFKRLENDLDVKNQWHSQSGPIPIRRHTPEELSPWQKGFMGACAELGFLPCADTNDPTTTGYGPHAMNKINGERMSAARCYLTPEVRARENLRIRPRALVRRVLIENRRVAGLEVETDGRVEKIAAKRVVLCGGAVATPGILLRSGVGPRRDIERLGVESVVDLPGVGARLLDHPGSSVFMVPRPGTTDPERFPLIQTVLRYTSKGSAYKNDMQLQPASFLPIAQIALPLVMISCCVGKPRGHGRIRYESADAGALPKIENEFLHDAEDRARVSEAMELAWLCASSASMRGLATFFWPGEGILASRRARTEWVGRRVGSGYHPCGTVPMGPDGDAGAAVDGRGRVRGVEGLFVADASIMPTIPSSNTNLPTLMIGERFGEWFRDGGV